MTLTIRPAAPGDADAWLRLRHVLWPDDSEADHRAEIDRFFRGQLREPLAVLLAEDESGHVLGMAELSIRSIVEGCTRGRVAYLEGWFVEPEARRRGVGRALVAAAEQWGRDQGCSEFASDTQLDNRVSQAAHHALGFIEVEGIRCFRKALEGAKADPITTFFKSYAQAFGRFDASAIASHFAFPLHVTAESIEIGLTAIPDERRWIEQVEHLLAMYRAIDVTSARMVDVTATEVSPRLFQAIIHWALCDRAGSTLYAFEAAYTLGWSGDRLKITAIAHNEIPRYREYVVRLRARRTGAKPGAAL